MRRDFLNRLIEKYFEQLINSVLVLWPNSMHKTHIFDQKNHAKKKDFTNLYLPYFFSDRYRKQTIFFSWPYAAGG